MYRLGSMKTGLQMKLDTTGVNIGEIKVPQSITEFTIPNNIDVVRGRAKYSFLKSQVTTGYTFPYLG